MSRRVVFLTVAKTRLLTAVSEMKWLNAEFVGAKIVNGLLVEVVLRASM